MCLGPTQGAISGTRPAQDPTYAADGVPVADYNVLTHSDMVSVGRAHYRGSAARAPEHHYLEATMIELTTNQSYDFVGVVPAWGDREPLYIFTSSLVLRDQEQKHPDG